MLSFTFMNNRGNKVTVASHDEWSARHKAMVKLHGEQIIIGHWVCPRPFQGAGLLLLEKQSATA